MEYGGEILEYIVQMKNISKQFPKVLANDNVNFNVCKGEVHALVGENGAGKSTLMNILYGLYTPTDGEIYINGIKVTMQTANDGIKHGVGMVHQHFMLIPRLKVVDNIVLGEEPRYCVFYNRKKAEESVKKVIDEYQIKVDINSKVEDISLGMQQKVEIIKLLYRKAEILILDEPTAVLTPQEIDELGLVIKKLKSMDKTIIIITHKLKEVIDFSDRVTVMRNGKIIGTVNTNETTPEELTLMMVGRNVRLGGEKKKTSFKEIALELKNVYYMKDNKNKLKDITLQVNKGEILGIAGIDNNGQKELTEIILGIIRPTSGYVAIDGVNISDKQIHDIRDMGVGFIPQDRQKHGLGLDLSVEENLILGYQRKESFIKKLVMQDFFEIKRNAIDKINAYEIKTPNEKAAAGTLSGGNQQKIIVAREIGFSSTLIVADQPTRGVDIGAIEFIHKMLVDSRNKGQGVLLVSLELDEVMLLSDRIAVIFEGEIMGIVDSADTSREEIGLMMAGKKLKRGIINE